MSRIFISYSRKNKQFVERLHSDLVNEGHYVWIDTIEIKAGEDIHTRIAEGVAEADFVIVVLSKNSLNSEYVKRELYKTFDKQIKAKSVIAIPVLLDKFSKEHIPLPFAGMKFVDFIVKSKYLESFAELLKSVGPPFICQDPKGFDPKKFYKEYFGFVTDDLEYEKQRELLHKWQRRNPQNFAELFETELRKYRATDKPKSISSINEARRCIYKRFAAIGQHLLDRQVSVDYIRKHYNEPNVIVYANVVFPLEMALRRILNGHERFFVLFFALFYKQHRHWFPKEYIDYYNEVRLEPTKEEVNRLIGYKLVRKTAEEVLTLTCCE